MALLPIRSSRVLAVHQQPRRPLAPCPPSLLEMMQEALAWK